MSEFKNKIEERRRERREAKSSSWINLLIKIAILIFIITIVRYALTNRGEKTEELIKNEFNQERTME